MAYEMSRAILFKFSHFCKISHQKKEVEHDLLYVFFLVKFFAQI